MLNHVHVHLGCIFSDAMKPLRYAFPISTSVLLTAAVLAPAANADGEETPNVVINEVESNGDPEGDWVELANTDPNSSVDVSGWGIVDDDDDHDPITLPEGTEIESGGYLVVHTEPDFGLGSDDTVTLTDPEGEDVDETTWAGHAATTWGRVPDMTGEFNVTGEPTKGLRNVESDGENDGSTTEFAHDPLEIGDVELTGDYVEDFEEEDMSGIDFGPDGTAYVVNNGTGNLYTLTPQEGNSYHIDSRHTLRYEDGSGELDTEGVTVGPDGALYVSTERDNSEGEDDTSRPSVLRYELDGAEDDSEVEATDEWNLSEFTGDIGANGGLETISWISDSGKPFFAVGVEETGEVLFVNLESGSDAELVQRYESPFEGVMATDYDASASELTTLCDEVCSGASQVLTSDAPGDSDFAPVDEEIQARPDGLDNFANEGYARFVEENGTERFLWADDGVSDGVSLRGAVSTGGDSDVPGSVGGSIASSAS